MDTIYKVGQRWRFSVDKAEQNFFYEGEIITITPTMILILDKVLQSQVVIYQNTITGAVLKDG